VLIEQKVAFQDILKMDMRSMGGSNMDVIDPGQFANPYPCGQMTPRFGNAEQTLKMRRMPYPCREYVMKSRGRGADENRMPRRIVRRHIAHGMTGNVV